MKMKTLTGLLAASTIFASGAAMADAIYLDAPGSGGNTDSFAQFGLNWTALSTYTDSNVNGVVDPGETVVDTVVKNYLKDGVTFLNYFGNMHLIPSVFEQAGYGSTWGLYFAYTINGTVISATGSQILANYTSGTIDIYYDDFSGRASGNAARDITTDPKVMSINITGSGGAIANFILLGEVASVNSGLFFFENGPQDFNTLVGAGVTISMRVDTNLDTNEVPSGPAGSRTLTRQSTLDGSASFTAVPEPSALALLGIGLVGLGAIRRSKKAA